MEKYTKDDFIKIRVNKETKRKFKELCKNHNISISEYLNKIIESKVNNLEAQKFN